MEFDQLNRASHTLSEMSYTIPLIKKILALFNSPSGNAEFTIQIAMIASGDVATWETDFWDVLEHHGYCSVSYGRL